MVGEADRLHRHCRDQLDCSQSHHRPARESDDQIQIRFCSLKCSHQYIHCLNYLLPPKKITSYKLRNNDCNYVLPQCNSSVFKRSFINWCLFMLWFFYVYIGWTGRRFCVRPINLSYNIPYVLDDQANPEHISSWASTVTTWLRGRTQHQHSCHKNFGQGRGVVDPVKIFLSSLITMQKFMTVSNTCTRMYSRTPKISGRRGPTPLNPLEIRPSITCYHTEFGRSRSNDTSVITGIQGKHWPCPAFRGHSRSSEPSRIDRP